MKICQVSRIISLGKKISKVRTTDVYNDRQTDG